MSSNIEIESVQEVRSNKKDQQDFRLGILLYGWEKTIDVRLFDDETFEFLTDIDDIHQFIRDTEGSMSVEAVMEELKEEILLALQ